MCFKLTHKVHSSPLKPSDQRTPFAKDSAVSNVIRLNVPVRCQSTDARDAALIAGFATYRRSPEDVFWLKENAALLTVLETTGAEPNDVALAPHQLFYATVEKRLGFFPQLYRFLLSICIDLEDLGLHDRKGEILAHWVAREGLADAEISDLHRLEARQLLLRRGIDPLPEDGGLEDRVRAFIDRSDTFAIPNRKAARELARFVFYLSRYGRGDARLSEAAQTSLEFAGIMAYLDQNAALLAEICIAQRYGGVCPSPIWEDWLERETNRFSIRTGPDTGRHDDYQSYLACSWLMRATRRDAFVGDMPHRPMAFYRGAACPGPLREISDFMYGMDGVRSDDWTVMRRHIYGILTETGHDILKNAEQSSEKFAAFFAGFARTGLRGVVL